jgi:hypothetical protein
VNCVCDDCNAYFGRELDQLLARDTIEGVSRYARGQLSSESRAQKGMETPSPRARKRDRSRVFEYRSTARERVLELDEAQAVWGAAGSLGFPFGPAYQLMLLTGCHPGEWSRCLRPYLHLDQALLALPADAYKSDHVHVVPLVPAAVDLLRHVLAYHPGGR